MRRLTFRMGNYLRGGEAFHFARKRLEPGPPRVVHTHDYFECFWIEAGQGIHWINGAKAPLGAGDLVFVRLSDTHGFQGKGSRPGIMVNVSFPASSAEHLADRYGADLDGRFFWTDEPMPRRHRLDEAQMAMLKRLARDLELGPRGLAQIESFLLALMTRVLGQPSGVTEHVPAWLSAACQAVQDPAVFRRGAAGFVRSAGRSHEHVCRATRQFLGLSPSAYVNRVRMEHAARLLAGSDETISDIALDCGLENLSHFYRVFRDHHQMTPRAYRRRHQVEIVQPRP